MESLNVKHNKIGDKYGNAYELVGRITEGYGPTLVWKVTKAKNLHQNQLFINDFNNGTVGWTDWNILLDENGGPNHKGNFCFAPIHPDMNTGELIYTPSYYYIGHFSKFIRPDAKRISTASSRSNLLSTTFKNPDGSIVTIVMNSTTDTIKYNLIVDKEKTIVEIPAHAIQTLVY